MPGMDWTKWRDEYGGAAELIPEGTECDFQIADAKAQKSQAGKDMFNMQCVVENGPHAKARVWHRIVISPESQIAMEIMWRNFGALGLPPSSPFWNNNPGPEQVAAALKERRFKGKVKVTEWQGVERNEIASMRPAGTTGAAPPPPPSSAAAPPPPPAPAAAAPPPAPAAAEAAPAPAPAPAPPRLRLRHRHRHRHRQRLPTCRLRHRRQPRAGTLRSRLGSRRCAFLSARSTPGAREGTASSHY